MRLLALLACAGVLLAVLLGGARFFGLWGLPNDEKALAARCTDVMRDDYKRSGDPGKAGLPPNAFAIAAPRACALGVERGLVASDGTMSEQAGRELALAVIRRMGVQRFHTLAFNELAVQTYRLATPGKVTRLDRCLAMGYSAWDAQPDKANLPPRPLFRHAVRAACAIGIKRGIIPASGAPVPNSPAARALQKLILANLVKLARR